MYNKEEVMREFVTKFPHDTLGYYADHAPADTHSPEDGSCLQCPVQCSYTEDIASFLSTALEAAYAAGKAERKVEHCAEPECPECNIAAYKAGVEDCIAIVEECSDFADSGHTLKMRIINQIQALK